MKLVTKPANRIALLSAAALLFGALAQAQSIPPIPAPMPTVLHPLVKCVCPPPPPPKPKPKK